MTNLTRKRRSKRKTCFTKRGRSLWDSGDSRKPARSFSESIAISEEFRKKPRLSI